MGISDRAANSVQLIEAMDRAGMVFVQFNSQGKIVSYEKDQ